MDAITYINRALKKLYGVSVDGHVNFRLVWSDSMIEKRNAETQGGIGVIEAQKYSYIRERYILEGYNPANKSNPEIAMSDGFEPIFVFDKNGQFLRPYLWACEYIINSLKNFSPEKRTEKMDFNLDKLKEEKEVADYFGLLTDMGSTELGTQFRYGEAIALPGKDFKS